MSDNVENSPPWNDSTIATFVECITGLVEVYSPEGAMIFMGNKVAMLDGERPTDLVRKGEGSAVLMAITALGEGLFT